MTNSLNPKLTKVMAYASGLYRMSSQHGLGFRDQGQDVQLS